MASLEKLNSDATAFLETHVDWMQLTSEEIRLLREREFKAASEVMKRKTPLVELYQKQLAALFENKELLMALDIETKSALKQSQLQFAEVGEIYQHELNLALKSSERIIEMIKRAITEQNTTSHFYGNAGAMKPAEAPRSVMINRKA